MRITVLTNESFDAISNHPAFDGLSVRELAEINRLANEQLVAKSVGNQIEFGFKPFTEAKPILKSGLYSYESLAANKISILNNTSQENKEVREQVIASSYKAFEILRLYPIPESRDEKIQFVFRVACLAYCGERWSDLRRWFSDNPTIFDTPPVEDEPWDQYIISTMYFCWTKLFCKQKRTELDEILQSISNLHVEQEKREKQFFDGLEHYQHRDCAIRLASLYYWVKCTENVTKYLLNGSTDGNPFSKIDMYYERAIQASKISGEWQIEYMLAWLHSTSRIMLTNSLWWIFRGADANTSKFVEILTNRHHSPIFELLPPQQLAISEGLLNPSKTAIVVDMPTSGGKTLLAQFKILQTLNRTGDNRDWVAYLTPTRALSSQITRRLRQDFHKLDIIVEQLTGALDINAFEDDLLEDTKHQFDILVTTPEKFQQIVRNKKIDEQPPSLVILDEAHNIEAKERGLRIELLLATLKQEFPKTSFLLLMPYAEGTQSIANWLAGDQISGLPITSGKSVWKPNERIIGTFQAVKDTKSRASWHLEFETLEATEKAIALEGRFQVGHSKPIEVPKSQVIDSKGQTGLAYQAVAMSKIMSQNGTSIAIGQKIPTVWNMAKMAYKNLPESLEISPEIKLVQDYLHAEVGSNFNLINYLSKGVAVHHSGLSDEVRTLIESLAESGQLSVLCATTTIAQGLNFPVSSVFLQTHKYPLGIEMSTREFWNLAGRVGRIGHDSIGVIGLAAGNEQDKIKNFIQSRTGVLASQLVRLLNELEENGELDILSENLWKLEWEDFRNYLVHLWVEKKGDLDAVLSATEQILRQTFGFSSLNQNTQHQAKADALRKASNDYIHRISKLPKNIPIISNQTGFSPEGIRSAMNALENLDNQISKEDWNHKTLFKGEGKMADLYGVMLEIPKLKENLKDVGGDGPGHSKLADITNDWVNGESIRAIATKYFAKSNEDVASTATISKAFQAINKAIINDGTWGVSAISNFSGIDFDKISETEKRQINLIPALIYHGVSTEEAVLMRMNSVPRSIAKELGHRYRKHCKKSDESMKVSSARQYLKSLDTKEWQSICPKNLPIGGKDYKRVWEILSGESNSL